MGSLLMFTLERIAYSALVAFVRRYFRAGLNEQFVLWIVIPRYLYSLVFSSVTSPILKDVSIFLFPLENIMVLVLELLILSFHSMQYFCTVSIAFCSPSLVVDNRTISVKNASYNIFFYTFNILYYHMKSLPNSSEFIFWIRIGLVQIIIHD